MKHLYTLAAATLAAATLTAAPLDGKKVAVFVDGATAEAVTVNQEKVAAQWLLANGDQAVAINVDNLSTLTPENVQALWIHIDRLNIEKGAANLPAPFNTPEFVAAIKGYVQAGGNLLLTKHATQLAKAIERIDLEVSTFGAGEGGEGFDTWTVQNVYGFNSDEKIDRSGHPIYAGLQTVMDYNEVPTVALLGTGDPATSLWREDRNCFWVPADLGFGENGSAANINTFDETYSCQSLGTWGHVGDFCGSGIIDFAPTAAFKGRILTIGLAAYEWAPRTGVNAFQANIEGMTANALNYLASEGAAIETIDTDNNAAPVYYNLQGVRVDAPQAGRIYIVRRGNTASKVIM